jgi:hypothetical protein
MSYYSCGHNIYRETWDTLGFKFAVTAAWQRHRKWEAKFCKEVILCSKFAEWIYSTAPSQPELKRDPPDESRLPHGFKVMKIHLANDTKQGSGFVQVGHISCSLYCQYN